MASFGCMRLGSYLGWWIRFNTSRRWSSDRLLGFTPVLYGFCGLGWRISGDHQVWRRDVNGGCTGVDRAFLGGWPEFVGVGMGSGTWLICWIDGWFGSVEGRDGWGRRSRRKSWCCAKERQNSSFVFFILPELSVCPNFHYTASVLVKMESSRGQRMGLHPLLDFLF